MRYSCVRYLHPQNAQRSLLFISLSKLREIHWVIFSHFIADSDFPRAFQFLPGLSLSFQVFGVCPLVLQKLALRVPFVHGWQGRCWQQIQASRNARPATGIPNPSPEIPLTKNRRFLPQSQAPQKKMKKPENTYLSNISGTFQ